MADGAKGTAIGTGVGAGIGALFGGVGAAPGAAIGGGAGKLLSGLFSKKKKAPPPPPWYKRYEVPLIGAGVLGILGTVLIVRRHRA